MLVVPAEEPLTAGMSTEGIVRVGDTVRRPTGPWTPSVHAFLRHLELEGFEAAPRVLGFDNEGREILTYVHGEPAGRDALVADEVLHEAARLVRSLHRASATFVPPPDARWRPPACDPGGGPIVLHGDLGGWNVIIDGARLTFIDWDEAAPGRPEWEIGYSLLSFADLWPDSDLSDVEAARRIRTFADGYTASKAQLDLALELLPQRCRWMSAGIVEQADQGRIPAVRMRDAGTHTAWTATAEHWDARLPTWRRLLSL